MRDSVRYRALADAKAAVESRLSDLQAHAVGSSEYRRQEIIEASGRIQTLMDKEYAAIRKRRSARISKKIKHPLTPEFAYVVEYIERDEGQRHEGYKCWLSMSDAKQEAEQAHRSGSVGSYYFGPVYPVRVIEVPWHELPVPVAKTLLLSGEVFISDLTWKPLGK